MMHPVVRAPSALLSLLIPLCLASAVAAQVVPTPADQIVVVQAGKSATVKIDSGGCNPSWVAVSDDEETATVSPASYDSGKQRGFKIEAPASALGSSTTVTVTLTDAACLGDPVDVTFQVYVVMDAKKVEKRFLSGDKGAGITGVKKRLSTFKKDLKAIEKDLKANHKALLKEFKAGEITTNPVDLVAEGGESPSLAEQAMRNALVFEQLAFQQIYAKLFATLSGIAFDGSQVLALYSFSPFFNLPVPLLPLAFLSGGCGAWDAALSGAQQIYLGELLKIRGLSKVFASKLAKQAAKQATPVIVLATLFQFQLANLGLISPFSPAPMLVPSAGTVYTPPLAIAGLRSLNVPEAGDHDRGRLFLMGTGDPAGSALTSSFQKVTASGSPDGDPLDGPAAVVASDGTWTLVYPEFGVAPTLSAGRWRVTIGQDATSVDGDIVIAAGAY